MPHEFWFATIGTLLALGALVWRLATLVTRFESGLSKLTEDIKRIEPRLVQLDAIAVIQRDVSTVMNTQGAQAAAIAKHHSDIAQLRVDLARADGAEAMRRSQGEYG